MTHRPTYSWLTLQAVACHREWFCFWQLCSFSVFANLAAKCFCICFVLVPEQWLIYWNISSPPPFFSSFFLSFLFSFSHIGTDCVSEIQMLWPQDCAISCSWRYWDLVFYSLLWLKQCVAARITISTGSSINVHIRNLFGLVILIKSVVIF